MRRTDRRSKNPASPIERGLPGPGLLAHVAVSKYSDHLPPNRREGILSRHGVDIRRSTMADWMAYGAHLLTTLVGEMKKRMLLPAVIHTDETPVTVQDPKGKSKPHTGRLWVYSGDRRNPYDVYEYSPDRNLSIDNDAAERKLRPVAVGRKNYLFFGSDIQKSRDAFLSIAATGNDRRTSSLQTYCTWS